MNKNRVFLDFFDDMVSKLNVKIPEDVQTVYDNLAGIDESKPLFTETGKEILKCMREAEAKSLKARDIADILNISSRKVSGAIRKLVSDNFVDKFGTNPVIYSLTELGRTYNIEEENNENE